MKRILLVILAVILGAGALAYFNKSAIVLFLASRAEQPEVAPNQTIAWQTGPAEASAPPDARPPNIVFILVDDLGINDLSTFGGGVAGGRVPTPNIDALAARGAIFSTAYSGTGTCAPSRAMLLTGRYPTRTGFEFTPTPNGMGRVVSMIANDRDTGLPKVYFDKKAADAAPDFEEQGLPGEEITIAEVLKESGYHTVHIGKWHLGNNAESHPNAQGFDESLLMTSLLHLPEDDPGVVNAKLDFDPIDKFLWARGNFHTSYNGGALFAPGGYLADYWTDESLKVIEANKNRPFFLYLAHWGVHTPLQATKADYDAVGDIEPHHLRVYAAMLHALDRSVGRIVEKLEAEGLADNTLIVFSSDNGGAGYIGLPGINDPYRGWKITLFEGGIRVPMFVSWPARIPAGKTIDTPVAHIDVMPTFASAAGAPLPAGVEIDGRDLLPLAEGTGGLSRPDDAIFWQSGFYRVVRAGGWKLQVDGKQKKSWLFDLANDPVEHTNLAESRPDKVAELQALLDRHHEGARQPLYASTTDLPIAIDKTGAEKATPEDEFVWWPN
ncbi:MAG: sulfatase [Hyphomonas sp.]|uniref:sulfatase n=1 Tax=Hyphomonas sp. TaxID=87 RepID=UPI00185D15B0|nr:sulfatase [Hyphomonas sp.]MBA3069958.1 sulfatase [Hyphomonas sp.]MBU4060466.1 sulfatase [Alphaproteobacteria bacterium]MBU4163134.1 sulfatase [Alphaproteobacteria bacterium]